MNLLSLSEALIEKKISPIEIVKHSLNSIEKKNSIYNIFITVCEEEALEAATLAEKEISKGIVKGPFHGIPVAIKDVIFTQGIRTTMGSKLYKNFVPSYNATVINKLIDAGAIIIGKANNHEFAYGPTGDRSFIGPCRNPYNPNKITGGSSSGSAAAIAADMAFAALGTDTGGSIRIPASACGIVGMKPTFGLISKYGIYNTAYTLDHPGPMTKTVKDNAIMLNLLAGYDSKDVHSINRTRENYTRLIGQSIAGKVIGLPSYYFNNIDKEVKTAIDKVIKVFQEQGAFIKEIELRGIEEISESQIITIQAEAYAVHAENIRKHGIDYDSEVYERLQSSKNVLGYEYVTAQQKRQQLINGYNNVFEEVDILLTPTLPILPTNINQRELVLGDNIEHVRHALLRLTSPTNYTGNPSLSVPCGLSTNGLPIGFQLIGMHGEESLLYQFGYSYEQNTPQ
ncbi:Asp-tRNA(Asn)/Glu-tRNA(Gln) amidotransferase GatCAB subunit A [Bacillus massiliigorillae]|uniref:Asp-tRNA(Asn)/Glu-tRNA(Gln) amidotransferase GatCAB subunit A n=1 Tax=Bacillus massiliigorillae TaxID=1243664 RepID=UPI0003A40395|nr:Asp-tRNA(Asn)/Glu-tRNA(Gln) amidotransferase GatCAB subunit A [Bacillus massiliigorillae]